MAKKGSYVLNDVGGMGGYTDFITTIYEGKDQEEKKQDREWSSGLGWNNRKVSSVRML